MKKVELYFSILYLTSVLSGCVGSGVPSGQGQAIEASQGNSIDPCADYFSDDDFNNRLQRMQLCTLVNSARAEHGLPPLILEPLRNMVAQAHAIDMAENNFASHTGSDGSSLAERLERVEVYPQIWGENVAWGATNAVSIMNWWMNSPGHKENILRPRFKYLGVGYENTRWVQVFTD